MLSKLTVVSTAVLTLALVAIGAGCSSSSDETSGSSTSNVEAAPTNGGQRGSAPADGDGYDADAGPGDGDGEPASCLTVLLAAGAQGCIEVSPLSEAPSCGAEHVIRAGTYVLDELTLLEASEDPSTDLAHCRQKHATRVEVDSCCHG